MTAPEELRRINDRAHLRTVHPDSLPWPVALPEEELAFYTRLCGLPPGRRDEARAYLAKELAQLADIERHISVCMGCLSGQAAESRMLGGVAMIDALMHFSAEECQHSNMFYRFVDLLLGRPLDRSGETLDARVGLFLGPESPESKLAALLGSAYPGESVITVFEHRARMLDPGHARFFTKMILAHGLDEARHVQLDHFVFAHVLPALSDGELRDAQRLYGAMSAWNHRLSEAYAVAVGEVLRVDFEDGNGAARAQRGLTRKLLRETLSGRSFRLADQALSEEDRAELLQFAGVDRIHPGIGALCL